MSTAGADRLDTARIERRDDLMDAPVDTDDTAIEGQTRLMRVGLLTAGAVAMLTGRGDGHGVGAHEFLDLRAVKARKASRR